MRLSIAEVNFALRPAFTIFKEYKMRLSIAEVNFALRSAFTIFGTKLIIIYGRHIIFIIFAIGFIGSSAGAE